MSLSQLVKAPYSKTLVRILFFLPINDLNVKKSILLHYYIIHYFNYYLMKSHSTVDTDCMK